MLFTAELKRDYVLWKETNRIIWMSRIDEILRLVLGYLLYLPSLGRSRKFYNEKLLNKFPYTEHYSGTDWSNRIGRDTISRDDTVYIDTYCLGVVFHTVISPCTERGEHYKEIS